MRELKFRVFDKELGKYLDPYPHGFSLIGETTIFEVIRPFDLAKLQHLVQEQYTGKKDKDNKEIYDGDIVLIDWNDIRYDPVISSVSWSDSEAGWCFGGGSTSEVGWSHKVIGTVNENKEMLARGYTFNE